MLIENCKQTVTDRCLFRNLVLAKNLEQILINYSNKGGFHKSFVLLVYQELVVPDLLDTSKLIDGDGPRLVITHIVNENFKSYAGVKKLGPFHKVMNPFFNGVNYDYSLYLIF